MNLIGEISSRIWLPADSAINIVVLLKSRDNIKKKRGYLLVSAPFFPLSGNRVSLPVSGSQYRRICIDYLVHTAQLVPLVRNVQPDPGDQLFGPIFMATLPLMIAAYRPVSER